MMAGARAATVRESTCAHTHTHTDTHTDTHTHTHTQLQDLDSDILKLLNQCQQASILDFFVILDKQAPLA